MKVGAALFDVYGTMLSSEKRENQFIFEKFCKRMGLSLYPSDEGGFGSFQSLIRKSHLHSRRKGIEHPEVDIREIWKEFLQTANEKEAERIALAYENAVNETAVMPGLIAVLEVLRGNGVPLGIVSNSQFYTPLLLKHHLGEFPCKLGFKKDLLIWSYRYMEAKPSLNLFNKALKPLLDKGLKASEVLFVGNDMVCDMVPAKLLGMSTVYLGDEMPPCSKADYVIKSLYELQSLLRQGSG